VKAAPHILRALAHPSTVESSQPLLLVNYKKRTCCASSCGGVKVSWHRPAYLLITATACRRTCCMSVCARQLYSNEGAERAWSIRSRTGPRRCMSTKSASSSAFCTSSAAWAWRASSRRCRARATAAGHLAGTSTRTRGLACGTCSMGCGLAARPCTLQGCQTSKSKRVRHLAGAGSPVPVALVLCASAAGRCPSRSTGR